MDGGSVDGGDDPFAKEISRSESSDDENERSLGSESQDDASIDAKVNGDAEFASNNILEQGDELKSRSSTSGEELAGRDQERRVTIWGQEAHEEATDDNKEQIGFMSQDIDFADDDMDEDLEDDDSDEDMGDGSSQASIDTEVTSSSREEAVSSDRAALRAMMASEQKSVIESLSAATRADAAKGAAVKQQQKGFDALLNTRIRLQKALVATNSLEAKDDPATILSQTDRAVIEAAETAALSLLEKLMSLRESFSSRATSASKKRPFSATTSTTTSDIHAALSTSEEDSLRDHRATLDKWARKTHATTSLSTRNKFSQSVTPSLTSVLDTQLSSTNLNRLVKRTQIPRSCAPVQAVKGLEDPLVYDDADWYALLLRDLVDTKMSSSSVSSNAPSRIRNGVVDPTTALAGLRRETKTHRQGVDTKASKGRKMRYTVHEKLQNFMAPQDLGTWSERQTDELFGGLLGRRVRDGLGENIRSRREPEDLEADAETEGLKLFSGSR